MPNWSRSIFALVTAVSVYPFSTSAESAREWVIQGNEAYRAGRFSDALAAYEKAASIQPKSPVILFDKATVLYQGKKYGEATRLFESAASNREGGALVARSKYNLGVCTFREAERLRGSDLDGAVAACHESVRYFQEALALQPDFKQAAENIEIVRLYEMQLRKKKENEKTKEPEQQNEKERDGSHQQEQELSDNPVSNPETDRPNGQSSSQNSTGKPERIGSGSRSKSESGSQSQSPSQPEPGLRPDMQERMQQQIHRQMQSQRFSSFHSLHGVHAQQAGTQRQGSGALSNEPHAILTEEKEARLWQQRNSKYTFKPVVKKDW